MEWNPSSPCSERSEICVHRDSSTAVKRMGSTVSFFPTSSHRGLCSLDGQKLGDLPCRVRRTLMTGNISGSGYDAAPRLDCPSTAQLSQLDTPSLANLTVRTLEASLCEMRQTSTNVGGLRSRLGKPYREVLRGSGIGARRHIGSLTSPHTVSQLGSRR